MTTKTITSFFFTIALVLGSYEALSQVPAHQLPLITVSGSAEIKVSPDEVILSIGVENRHEDVIEAKRQNDDRTAKVLQFLKDKGIPQKDIQTDYITVDPHYDDKLSRTKPASYNVSKSIQVKLTKVETFESILTGLITKGITTVHGIDFRTTEMRKYRDAARTMAIRAAKEKADALTKELGVKTGKPHSIKADDSSQWYGGRWGRGGFLFSNVSNSSQNFVTGSESGDSDVAIGQIRVTASVDVSFLIE